MSATLHDTAADRRKATRREWIGLAVVALPCLVYAMDLTVLNLALPVLSRELQPSSAQLLWILDIYGFFVAGFLITMGMMAFRSFFSLFSNSRLSFSSFDVSGKGSVLLSRYQHINPVW